MAYSVIYANGDGSTKTFAISFPLGFISRSDVTCRVGDEVDGANNPVFRTLTWISDGLVTLSGTAPPVGVSNVKFYRTVSKTELVHDYANGVAIEEENLDESNKQLLMALHEFMDGRNTPTRLEDLDVNGYKVENLAPGTVGTDAVNYSQIAAVPEAVVAAEAAKAAAEAAKTAAEAAKATAEASADDAAASAAEAAMNVVSAAMAPVCSASTVLLGREKLGAVYVGGTAPAVPYAGMIWYDTSGGADTYFRFYDGTAWVLITYIDSNAHWANLSSVTYVNDSVAEAALLSPNLRISLTSGTTVTTSDVTAATTLYANPYKGNRIALYDGTSWRMRTFTATSLSLSGYAANKNFDIFGYMNGSAFALESVVWTDDLNRATNLAYQDGVLVKMGDATRRYLGTIRTTGTIGQTEDSLTSRYVWNYYNRVLRPMKRLESTASWTYTTAAYRQANANAANQLNFVLGVAEDAVKADVLVWAGNNSGIQIASGIGIDSTSVNSADVFGGYTQTANMMGIPSSFGGILAAGKHSLTWLEYSTATGTTTWFGTTNQFKGGIKGSVFA